MPRNAASRFAIVVAVTSGCVFDASYQSGHTTCSDGACPSGLVCNAEHVCVAPGQGSNIDGGMSTSDASHDAAVEHALTCADPGELTSAIAVSGSTVDRSNTVDPMCGGAFMNGPDAVYAIAIGASQSLDVSLTGSNELAAYVVATCAQSTCLGSAYASTAPIDVSPGSAGTYYIVVDSEFATGSGTYTLTVTVD